MPKIKNVTPIPTEQHFEVTLTKGEIKDITETAGMLYQHRTQIASMLKLHMCDKRIERALSILFALSDEDPLDDIEDCDEGFLLAVEMSRL